MFVSMSWRRSIYVVAMLSMFQFQPHFPCHESLTTFKQSYVFCVHLLEHLLSLLDDNVDEKSE